jgi:hypothetical protein
MMIALSWLLHLALAKACLGCSLRLYLVPVKIYKSKNTFYTELDHSLSLSCTHTHTEARERVRDGDSII